mgnify:CR=1 FL=1
MKAPLLAERVHVLTLTPMIAFACLGAEAIKLSIAVFFGSGAEIFKSGIVLLLIF